MWMPLAMAQESDALSDVRVPRTVMPCACAALISKDRFRFPVVIRSFNFGRRSSRRAGNRVRSRIPTDDLKISQVSCRSFLAAERFLEYGNFSTSFQSVPISQFSCGIEIIVKNGDARKAPY